MCEGHQPGRSALLWELCGADRVLGSTATPYTLQSPTFPIPGTAMGKHSSKLAPEMLDDLVRSTEFSEQELKQWYKGFLKDCPTGILNLEEFQQLYIKVGSEWAQPVGSEHPLLLCRALLPVSSPPCSNLSPLLCPQFFPYGDASKFA